MVGTPLKNISRWMSMGRIIPYIMENKNHAWNHQPVIFPLNPIDYIDHHWFSVYIPTKSQFIVLLCIITIMTMTLIITITIMINSNDDDNNNKFILFAIIILLMIWPNCCAMSCHVLSMSWGRLFSTGKAFAASPTHVWWHLMVTWRRQRLCSFLDSGPLHGNFE